MIFSAANILPKADTLHTDIDGFSENDFRFPARRPEDHKNDSEDKDDHADAMLPAMKFIFRLFMIIRFRFFETQKPVLPPALYAQEPCTAGCFIRTGTVLPAALYAQEPGIAGCFIRTGTVYCRFILLRDICQSAPSTLPGHRSCHLVADLVAVFIDKYGRRYIHDLIGNAGQCSRRFKMRISRTGLLHNRLRRLNLGIADFPLLSSVSIGIPTIWKPLSLYSAARVLSSGISLMQGPQKVAQTLTIVSFAPLKIV